MDSSGYLWGKEKVIAQLMRDQRANGRVDPYLITFAPGRFSSVMAAEGFRTVTLGERGLLGTQRCIRALASELAKTPVSVVHSHGYKANLSIRALRALGKTRNIRIVSTCHGWEQIDAKLRFYHAMDRWSTRLSDVTTVPDSGMLGALPHGARAVNILNAVPERTMRDNVTIPFPYRGEGAFFVGVMGRLTAKKGILDVLEAARLSAGSSIVFVIAGAGELLEAVQAGGPNVTYVGYLADPEPYVAALDVYLQASHAEGLSLSLLEAMRGGKAIIATDVGATRDAISEDSAIVIPPGNPQAILDAIALLKADPPLRLRLGRAARARYEAEFTADTVHDRFLELYQVGQFA